MKKFQSLENPEEKVPTIGSFALKSSNHWKFLCGILPVLGVLMIQAPVQAGMPCPEPVPVRWRGPGEQPQPPPFPKQPYSFREIAREEGSGRRAYEPGQPATGRIAVVVATNIYGAVSNAVRVYTSDLKSNGFATVTATFSGSAEELRATLTNWYGEAQSLKGAVLVGEMPYVTWEMLKCFNDGITNYAADLADIFFMDLDGVWEDTNSTPPFTAGRYDTRSGDLNLEIWVSRLRGQGITAATGAYTNEVTVLTNYFYRLHRYRTGALTVNKKGLTYTDNDWNDYKTMDQTEMQVCYPTNVITRAVGVDAGAGGAEFRDSYMTQNVEMMQIRCHGYAQAQTFDDGVSITSATWTNKDPRAVFYNIYGCSAGDYLSANNLARIAIFNKDANGLVSWSHSGTGGMIGFWDYDTRWFFDTLGEGETVGEAFRQWYNGCVDADRIYYEEYWKTPKWWNGMILNGDGALTVRTPRYLYVATNGNHAAPFASWADAATNVHDAFDLASPGDIILIGDGRHFLTHTLAFTTSKAITLRGAGTNCSAILDGSLSGSQGFSGSYQVNATIENLGICNFRGYTDTYGAGGRMKGGTIRNCVFTNNHVLGYGAGGALVVEYETRVEDCVFTGNSTADSGGGALQVMNRGPVIYNCYFSNNVSKFAGAVLLTESGSVLRCRMVNNCATGTSIGGGAMYVVGNGSQIWNTEIRGNLSHNSGGGVYMYRGWLCNSLVADNTASNQGGGVWSSGYTNTETLGSFIQNCTVAGNSAETLGSGIYADKYTFLVNSIVYGNGTDDWCAAAGPEITAGYSCFGEAVPGVSNLNANPVFAGVGDYSLQGGSPCIDAAMELPWHLEMFDLAGLPRVAGSSADMGAIEYQGGTVEDSDGDGMPDWWETLYGLNPADSNDAPAHADSDPVCNLHEYIADTDPTDSNNWFQITNFSNHPAQTVYFTSSTGRLYTLLTALDLPGGTWTNIPDQGPRAGCGGADSMTDTNAAGERIYGVRVQLQ